MEGKFFATLDTSFTDKTKQHDICRTRNRLCTSVRIQNVSSRTCFRCGLELHVEQVLLTWLGTSLLRFFTKHKADLALQEFYSSTSAGAMQGNGYVFHAGEWLPRTPSTTLV